jgi:ribulose-5-phosphate 4-epimerase/fuculose-1-phosphate aldolase
MKLFIFTVYSRVEGTTQGVEMYKHTGLTLAEFARMPPVHQMRHIGHWLGKEGLSPEDSGNMSVRHPTEPDVMLITTTGAVLGELSEETIARVRISTGDPLDGKIESSESGVHRFQYAKRPFVGAVLHLHAEEALTLSCHTDPRISDRIHIDVLLHLRSSVECAQFEGPGTTALARQVLRAMSPTGRACLMANHGAVVVGENLYEASRNAQMLERLARRKRILGKSLQLIPEAKMPDLRDAISAYHMKQLASAA